MIYDTKCKCDLMFKSDIYINSKPILLIINMCQHHRERYVLLKTTQEGDN